MSERFPFGALAHPLEPRDRRALRARLAALLAFQHRLAAPFPRPTGRAPDATPFVSVYVHGALRGCFGSHEGGPGERIARAFLLAIADVRFGGVAGARRADLAAQLSYPRAARRTDADGALAMLEPGTHGVALVRASAGPVAILPAVARDHGHGAKEMLAALARKAGGGEEVLREGTLFLFETEDVAAHPGGDARGEGVREDSPQARAAAWLARQVGPDGAVRFRVDARTGAQFARGEGYHARAAVALRALAAHGGHAKVVARGRRHLAREVAAALAGKSAEHWPAHAAPAAGTLALVALAEVPGAREGLARYAEAQARAIAAQAWYAAQVVCVLGRAAPRGLWEACVKDLDARPWAPWTALAAQACGDGAVLERCARALAESLRARAPHAGGAGVTAVPQLALTAAAVEALAPLGDRDARAAVERGRAFLLRWQLGPERACAAHAPRVAHGAFPASPVADLLRCDITGHCLLALTSP